MNVTGANDSTLDSEFFDELTRHKEMMEMEGDAVGDTGNDSVTSAASDSLSWMDDSLLTSNGSDTHKAGRPNGELSVDNIFHGMNESLLDAELGLSDNALTDGELNFESFDTSKYFDKDLVLSASGARDSMDASGTENVSSVEYDDSLEVARHADLEDPPHYPATPASVERQLLSPVRTPSKAEYRQHSEEVSTTDAFATAPSAAGTPLAAVVTASSTSTPLAYTATNGRKSSAQGSLFYPMSPALRQYLASPNAGSNRSARRGTPFASHLGGAMARVMGADSPFVDSSCGGDQSFLSFDDSMAHRGNLSVGGDAFLSPGGEDIAASADARYLPDDIAQDAVALDDIAFGEEMERLEADIRSLLEQLTATSTDSDVASEQRSHLCQLLLQQNKRLKNTVDSQLRHLDLLLEREMELANEELAEHASTYHEMRHAKAAREKLEAVRDDIGFSVSEAAKSMKINLPVPAPLHDDENGDDANGRGNDFAEDQATMRSDDNDDGAFLPTTLEEQVSFLLQRLQNENGRLSKELARACASSLQLEARIEEVSKEHALRLERKEGELNVAENNIKRLEEEAVARSALRAQEQQTAKNNIDEMLATHRSLLTEIEETGSKLSDASTSLMAVKDELTRTKDALRDANDRLVEVENESLRTVAESRQHIEATTELARDNAQALHEEITSLSDKHAATVTLLEEATHTRDTLAAQVESLKAEVEERDSTIAERDVDIAAQAEKVRALQSRCDDLRTELASTHDAALILRQESGTAKYKVEGEVERLLAANDALSGDLTRSRTETAEFREQLSALVQERVQLDEHVKETAAEKLAQDMVVDDLRTRIAEMKERLIDVRKERESVISKSAEMIDDLTNRLSLAEFGAEEALHELEAERDRTSSEVALSRGEVTRLQVKCDELESRLVDETVRLEGILAQERADRAKSQSFQQDDGAKASAAMEGLRAELDSAVTALSVERSLTAQLREEVEEVNVGLEEFIEEHATVQVAAEEAERKQGVAEAEARELRGALDLAHSEIVEATDHVDAIARQGEEKITAFQVEIERLLVDHAASVDAVIQQRDALRAEIERLSTADVDERQRQAVAVGALDELERKLKERDDTVRESEERSKRLALDLETQRQHYEALLKHRQQEQQQQDQQQGQKQHSAPDSELIMRAVRAEERVRHLEEQHRNVSGRFDMVAEQRSADQQTIHSLQSHVAHLEAELGDRVRRHMERNELHARLEEMLTLNDAQARRVRELLHEHETDLNHMSHLVEEAHRERAAAATMSDQKEEFLLELLELQQQNHVMSVQQQEQRSHPPPPPAQRKKRQATTSTRRVPRERRKKVVNRQHEHQQKDEQEQQQVAPGGVLQHHTTLPVQPPHPDPVEQAFVLPPPVTRSQHRLAQELQVLIEMSSDMREALVSRRNRSRSRTDSSPRTSSIATSSPSSPDGVPAKESTRPPAPAADAGDRRQNKIIEKLTKELAREKAKSGLQGTEKQQVIEGLVQQRNTLLQIMRQRDGHTDGSTIDHGAKDDSVRDAVTYIEHGGDTFLDVDEPTIVDDDHFYASLNGWNGDSAGEEASKLQHRSWMSSRSPPPSSRSMVAREPRRHYQQHHQLDQQQHLQHQQRLQQDGLQQDGEEFALPFDNYSAVW
eukprot:TRINITY_DN5719_c0_g1_i1.p1 TRINITY_DN5719_c0_g1~~TRINITY_DN5719_c0_g1_i1.p1  ORF type:complete len:1642 (+),score=500.72 TRINITY_DN5719_c0_g1_i1:160-5085(+)